MAVARVLPGRPAPQQQRPQARRAQPGGQRAPVPSSGWDWAERLKQLNESANPWTYFDTRYLSANTMQGDAAAFNFAQWTTPLQMFNTHTQGNGGPAVTSMYDTGKMEADFVCESITVEVWCPSDAPAAAAVATAAGFVEEVVNSCTIQLQFGSTTIVQLPVAQCPAGGGVNELVRQRLQAVAANSEISYCTNGLPTGQAVRKLTKPVLFRKGDNFTFNLLTAANGAGTAGPLHRIQGLQALTGDFTAGVRVNLNGFRGSPLLKGVSLPLQ